MAADLRGDADPGNRICGWRTGYEGTEFGTYAAVLAGAILVWELLPVLAPRLSMRGWPAGSITAILGVALAVTTLVKLIEDNEFQTIWAWIGLALALAIDARRADPRALPVGDPRQRQATSGRAAGRRRARAARRARAERLSLGATYGGDQVSTWSVLRSSSEPRSPVGLVKQPAQKASAKNDLALAA